MRFPVAALALAGLIAQPAGADTHHGFEAEMAAALADAGVGAPVLRCAGLFRALRATSPVGSEAEIAAQDQETAMAAYAIAVRQTEFGEDTEAAIGMVAGLVDATALIYLGRLHADSDATGSVEDDGIAADTAFCHGFRDLLDADRGQ